MIFLSKKKREQLEWLIGGALYYALIPKEDEVDVASLFIKICDATGLDCKAVAENRKAYGIAKAFEWIERRNREEAL